MHFGAPAGIVDAGDEGDENDAGSHGGSMEVGSGE